MRSLVLPALAALTLSAPCLAQGLRIVTWNITNYGSGRADAIEKSVYAEFEGRSLSPDVIVLQEVLSNSAVFSFLNIINTAPNSPGDWAAAPFINGNDTDNACFYRTSRVDFLAASVIATGGLPPNQPRDTNRYDLRPIGYTSPEATIAIYSTHMKAGSDSDDQARRLLEAQRIRDDAESLPQGWHAILLGDFNIQTSSQSAYQELIGSQANNDGRFFDPIARPGSWQNNSFYRYVHTQDPTGAGGMDDRYDQILLSTSLTDADALSYIGASGTPYSVTTWNDPNHSYRCWGNDGSSYNSSLTVSGNAMVGPVIAQALKDSTGGQAGHLPVYLDLRVPASISAPEQIDFGFVPVGAVSTRQLSVTHDANVALWGLEGIDQLDYELLPSPGVSAPPGPFDLSPGQSAEHDISVQSAAAGPFTELVIVSSDDPDQPDVMVEISGEFVVTCSVADLAPPFGAIDFSDIVAFLTAFDEGDAAADLAPPIGTLDFSDVVVFLGAFAAGCP